MRIVSLVPSITESLRAAGIDPVACTRFCEQPDLAHVGGTKNPDVDAIAALRPDLVLVDRQENRREDADALAARGIDVLATDVCSLGSVDVELARIGAAVGVAFEPVGAVTDPTPVRIRAFVPIWKRPLMTIGNETYGASLLESIGVGNVFAGAIDYPTTDLAEVIALAPDVVVVPSEPYAFKGTDVEAFGSVAPTVEVDGQDLFWWGVRTSAARRRLAGVLAPYLNPA